MSTSNVMALRLKRADFAKALRTLARTGQAVEDAQAILTLADGNLTIGLAGGEVTIPADGDWTGEVRLRGAILERLAKSLPDEDPLPIRVEQGRFYVARLSIPCEHRLASHASPINELIPPDADPFDILMIRSWCSAGEIDAAGAAGLIVEAERRVEAYCRSAARFLGRYGVSAGHLRKLCEDHAANGTRTFRDSDTAVIKQIARAWEILAPMGIEPGELKALMDDCLRNAWRHPK